MPSIAQTWFPALLLLSLAASSGCRTGPFRHGHLDRPVAFDRVLVVGSARTDPVIDSGARGTAMITQLQIGFTLGPYTPYHRRTHFPQLDGWTWLPPEGGDFIVEAPRRSFYLRALTKHYNRVITGANYMGEANTLDWYTICDDNLRVNPEPNDEVIYIGSFTCRHQDGTPIELEAADEFERVRATLPADVTVVRRLATRDGPLTSIDRTQLDIAVPEAGARALLRP